MLKIPVLNERTIDAFLIAEKYQHFPILVNLTLNASDKESRTRDYVHRFQSDFSSVFFKALLDRGLQQELMSQPDEYNDLLESFLATQDQHWLACLHQLRVGKYSEAHSEGSKYSETEETLSKKKVII